MTFGTKLRQDAGAVWIFLLVFLAGALNCAGLLRYGQTLSHMTGNLTRMGLSLSGEGGGAFWLLLACVLCFFLGATVSGCGFPDHRAGLWRRCGLALMAGGSLLFLSDWLRVPQGVGAAALAMALGFAALARATARRARTGDPHSVWADPARPS